jgi:hypothetical protein
MKRYRDNKLSEFFRISVGIPIAIYIFERLCNVFKKNSFMSTYCCYINRDIYDTDVQPNIIASSDYALLRLLFSRLFSIPATSAPVERVFSQGSIIMRPHRAKMSDDLHAGNADVLELQLKLRSVTL